jgi:hypothetical protein
MRPILAFVMLVLLTSCHTRPESVPVISTFQVDPDIQRRIDSHRYPKLSNQLQLCCRQKHTIKELNQIHYWDVAVVEVELIPNLPEYLGASGSIRKLNPGAIILGVFSAGDVYKSYDQPIHKAFYGMFLPGWYLYDVEKKPVPLFKIDSEWTLAQNPTTEVNKQLPAFLSRNVLAENLIDGILYDWATTSVSWLNHRKPARNKAVDIDNNAKRDSDRKVDQLWTQGFSQMLRNSRATFPDGALILGDGGWNNGYEYSPFLNGLMFEQFMEGRRWNRRRFGWGAIMKTYAHYQNTAVKPRLSIVMVNQDNQNDFRAARFGLASTLMFDGYFTFSNRNGAYRVSRWFDEYSVDVQSGKAEQRLEWKGYLGNPAGPAFHPKEPSLTLQMALSKNPQSAEQKVWRRDFEKGIALVNPSKTAQDVELNGRFRKIQGQVDPVFNDGSLLTTIRIPGEHGMILLKDFHASKPE